MTRRSRFFPPDNLTHGEILYLERRYTDEEIAERSERIVLELKRLVRKGKDHVLIHQALMAGMNLWEEHRLRLLRHQSRKRWNVKVARARRDVERAIASLRDLLGPASKSFDDDSVLRLREQLMLEPVEEPTAKRGRPWSWKQETEASLRAAGIGEHDRHGLLSAIGFLEDE